MLTVFLKKGVLYVSLAMHDLLHARKINNLEPAETFHETVQTIYFLCKVEKLIKD